MGRERHGDDGFAQSVCLDRLAASYQAKQERKRTAPTANTPASGSLASGCAIIAGFRTAR